MGLNQGAYRGCLLGLAVGDAMGYTVDGMTMTEIRRTYGEAGLLGYDLCNGYADVTSYTQLAAFTCNGLLLALTRGQMVGKMAPLVKYVGLSGREWVASQRPWGRPDKTFCWLMQRPEICRRHCMETRMLDTLSRLSSGVPEEAGNGFVSPGGLTAAVGVGLFYNRHRMAQEEIDRLGAEAVSLSHGGPLAFLSGAVLAHMVSRCLHDPEISFAALVSESIQAVKNLFGRTYSHQCNEIANLLNTALHLSNEPQMGHVEVMEQLHCQNAAQVLAGAVYACLAGYENFDASLIIAVNHSGRSCAVGALTGALLGLRQREEALPTFYVECLEPAEILMELADDMYHGCPMELGNRLFDADWDFKYVHGGR